MNILPRRIKDDKWKLPKWSRTDASTHKHHVTKWSDSRNGQVKDGGWGPGAFSAMNEHIQFIAKRRVDDHESGVKNTTLPLNLCAEKTTSPLILQKKRPEIKRSEPGSQSHMLRWCWDEPHMDVYDDPSMPIYEA